MDAAATGAAPVVAQPVQEGTAAADFIPLEESVEETASAQGKKAKNPAKVKCHRCGIVGHFAIDCVTELCINCELPGHAEDDCPLLTAPKPHMIMYSIGEERLCFFELPCTNSYKPKMENSRLGTLAVTGGDMNIPQIVCQLQRLVPSEDFHWDVRQVGHNVYKVAFPTKADLERLRVFGTFKVPDSLIDMKFDSWAVQIEPNCLLPEVWLRVSGLPPRRKGDFLAMWGLGTLFGKTLKVDMKYTRQHGVARILIGYLDYTCIPNKMNVLVVDGFYDLTFEVEIPEGADVEMESSYVDGSDKDGDDTTRGQDKGKQKQATDNSHTVVSEEGNASTEMQTDAGEKQDPKSSQSSVHTKCPRVVFSPHVQRMIDTSKHMLLASVSPTVQDVELRREQLSVDEHEIREDHQVVHEDNLAGHTAVDRTAEHKIPGLISAANQTPEPVKEMDQHLGRSLHTACGADKLGGKYAVSMQPSQEDGPSSQTNMGSDVSAETNPAGTRGSSIPPTTSSSSPLPALPPTSTTATSSSSSLGNPRNPLVAALTASPPRAAPWRGRRCDLYSRWPAARDAEGWTICSVLRKQQASSSFTETRPLTTSFDAGLGCRSKICPSPFPFGLPIVFVMETPLECD
ncbi:hypothetical protein ACQ4PT_043029 [Festuca glaucescens]